MNKLEIIGEGLKDLFDKLEENKETSFATDDKNNAPIFVAMADDKESGKTLFFDAYDRDLLSYYDYVGALVHMLNASCAQKEENGEISLSAHALLEAIINFTVMWCIDNPENQKRFDDCMKFYLDKQSKDSEA